MIIEASKNSNRVVINYESEWVFIELWSSNGLDKAINDYSKNALERLDELIKAKIYFKGEKSHVVQALKLARVQLEKVA